MRRSLGALTVMLVLVTPSAAHAWSFELHRFIMDRAIDLLPPALKPVFERNRAIAIERSVDPDTWRTVGFAEEDPNHFLNIDAAQYGGFPFRELPREYGAAVQKFGVERIRTNGTLPWRIEEFYGNVRRAFQNVDTRLNGRFELMVQSAALGHYISDATQPFHTVSNFDGQLTRQNGLHVRFERMLFERYRTTMTIAPAMAPPVKNPLDVAFETILESSQLAAQILKADADAIGSRDVYDDAYFEAFFRATRPVLERRIGAAIGAVAAMITGAWEAAGAPAISADPRPRSPERRRRP